MTDTTPAERSETVSLSRVRYRRRESDGKWEVVRETVRSKASVRVLTVTSLRGAKMEVRRLSEDELDCRAEEESW